MRHLLNTLYVFTEDAYLTLDGENVVVRRDGDELGRVPLHTLEGILCFSYRGASPGLMGACAERGVALSFFDRKGRFLAGVQGEERGNVLLRKAQYAWSEDPEKSLAVARNFIVGKLYNGRWVLERAVRDHGMRIDADAVKAASARLRASRWTRCVASRAMRRPSTSACSTNWCSGTRKRFALPDVCDGRRPTR